jgi:hypothetical protein
MLDIEKMHARARTALLTISGIGVVVVGAGVFLATLIITREANKNGGDWVTGLGPAGGAIILVAVGMLITCMPWAVLQMVNILVRRASDERYRTEQMMGTMDTQRQILEHIRDTTLLSDAAKQVAYRAKDLEVLRKAIREDMSKGDFEAATMLVNEMERRFGYALEADKLREEINEKNRRMIDQRVADTVEHVDLLCTRFEWNDATRESERLLRLFPSHPEARKLPGRIQNARDGHKRDLLKQWKDAVARDDVDQSIELLRQLDQYLSPSEAEAYKESARDVFRKRLQQLGVQFALHVHDKSWAESLKIGRQIIAEFPNTRMANEVRERMPILEEKAHQTVSV